MKRTLAWAMLLLILSPMLSLPAFASGQREERLTQAKQLIEEKKYDSALKLLVEVFTDNPTFSAEAQLYIDLIMREKRQRINELKKQILEKMKGDYDEEVLKVMEELKAVDPEESTGWIEQTRILWRIIKIEKEFNKLMDTAALALGASKYQDAINAYKSVFSLHWDDFKDNKTYGNILQAQITELLAQNNQILSDFLSQIEASSQEVKAFVELLNQERWNEARLSFNAAAFKLQAVLKLYREMLNISQRFNNIDSLIKGLNPTGKGDYFIFYAGRAFEGRLSVENSEGLLFALEHFWYKQQQILTGALTQFFNKHYTLGKERYEKALFDLAKLSFKQALEGARLLAQSYGQGLLLLEQVLPLRPAAKDQRIIKTLMPAYLVIQQRRAEIYQYLDLIDKRLTYNILKTQSATDEATLRDNRKKIRVITEGISQMQQLWQRRETLLTRLTKAFLSPAQEINLTTIKLELTDLLRLYQELDLDFSSALVAKAKNSFEVYLDAGRQSLKEARLYREGVKEADGLLKKYPSRTITILDTLAQGLNLQADKLNSVRQEWAADYDYIVASPQMKLLLSQVDLLQKDYVSLAEIVAAEKKLAQEQKTTALSYKNQADFEYQRAKASFERKDYNQSRENLNRAINAYNLSLANEENNQLRTLLEGELKSFSERVFAAILEQKLAEIRKNIDEGILLYNLTNFEAAEKKFNYAKKLQTDLYQDPTYKDEEIENWLTLIDRALKSQPKREILEKDPAYAEMTKRLNLATEDYNLGLKAQREKNNTLADDYFKQALQLISQIKKEYPYHRESGVLYLKIQRALKGEEVFRKDMATLVTNALREPNLQKALSDLKDLQEIDPNFPGLKQALAQIEARLYPKQEITPEAIAESLRLTDQAKLLYDSKLRDNYKEALILLNRALFLNPPNIQAQRLKTLILQELNSGADYPISDADQKLLLEVERLVVSGDWLGANAILQQLWLNPLNRANPKIINLKMRIEANL